MYRYGHNGQFKDNEWAGVGNHIEFKERLQDTRTGRFISADPLVDKYPWNSPYNFAEDRPIDGRDLEGREWENMMSRFKHPGKLHIKLPDVKTAQIQRYRIISENSRLPFEQVKNMFKAHPDLFLSNSKATFASPVDGDGKPSEFTIGSFIHIDIGAFYQMASGYVQIVDIKDKQGSFEATFATMEGHVEKGLIKFTLNNKGNGSIGFEIRSASNVDQGVAHKFEGTARDAQRASWMEVMHNFVKTTGGTEKGQETTIINPNDDENSNPKWTKKDQKRLEKTGKVKVKN